jgi:uncharacterized alkaline shock family protein YloU
MTTIPSPQEQAAVLGRALAVRIPRVEGVAHLALGWRDLVAQLPGGAAVLPRRLRAAAVYRGDGIEVRIAETGTRVRVAVALAWPHPAPAVCEAVQAAVAQAATEITGTQTHHVHVAIRDIHFHTDTFS